MVFCGFLSNHLFEIECIVLVLNVRLNFNIKNLTIYFIKKTFN